MRSDLYASAVRRVTRLLLVWVCAYLYIGGVVTLAFDDFPIAIIHVAAVVALAGVCWYIVRAGKRDGSNVGPGPDVSTQFLIRFAAVALVFMSLALALAVATASAIDAELRREVLAPVTTCERSKSGIATADVDETIESPGVSITVEQVTYGVPQRSEHPQPYEFECQQATFVEVLVERDADAADVDTANFEVRAPADDDISAEGYPDEYQWYADQEDLELIERTSFTEADGAVRGWMVFPMKDTIGPEDQVLAFVAEYGDPGELVRLPDAQAE